MSGPHVILVGVNHSTTPLAVRERLSVPRSRMPNALEALRDHVREGVILATCNRTEVYAVDSRERRAESAVLGFLQSWSGIPGEELDRYLYEYHDHTAMRHLLSTASGLRSMIIGEYEILGQVRQALEDAERAQMAGLPLRNLFQRAISTGRRVRDETGLSRNALSVSSVAVDLASGTAGDLRGCTALLVGAGEAGKLAARALSERGVAGITVASRSLETARELATALCGRPVDVDSLYDEMQAADIVITCTGAPHFVIQRVAVEKIMHLRAGRPLVIVDIAVPRDVEPEVADIDGVSLYDIDDLNRLSETNRRSREKEIEKATCIVDEEMERLTAWWQHLEAKPVIGALRQMAEDVRQRQLELTVKRLPELSPEELQALDAMTRAIVKKILHNPIQCLKSNGHSDADLTQTVCQLFALDERGSE
jgi:glutamyl-tRNA reductase